MRIRRLEIRNFKKLVGPIVIDGLGDGVSVIAGDNEDGKSTVLSALRAALFVRHKLSGEEAEAMRPFGLPNVAPQLGVTFEMQGRTYRLRKTFCQGPSAELSGPDGHLTGPAVEERLCEILGFDPPKKGAGGVMNQGLFGLLWVEQGKTFEPLNVNDRSRQTLLGAMESEVGAVLGGMRGRKLLDAVAKALAEHYTERVFKPRGALAEAQKELSLRETELAEAERHLAEYESKVDELARLRARLKGYDADDVLGEARRAVEAADAEMQRIAALEAALERAAQDEKLAEATLTLAAEKWQKRQQDSAAIEAAEANRAALAAAHAAAEAALAPVATASESAAARLAETKQALGQVEQEIAQAEKALDRAKQGEALAALRARLDKARAAKAEADAATAAAEAIRVGDAALNALRDLDRAVRDAAARLEAAATGVAFELRPGISVAVDGKPVPADGKLALTTRAVLAIGDMGHIVITPGGLGLDERRKAAEAASAKLADALAKCGVADMEEAERQNAARRRLIGELEMHKRLVAAHAPTGLDALETELRRAEARLASLGAADDGVGIGPEEAATRLAAARKLREQIQAADRAAETEHAGAQAILARAREREKAASAALAEAQRNVERLQADLAASRAAIADEQLVEQVNQARAVRERAASVADAARHALASAEPEAVKLRRERLAQAFDAMKRDIDATRQAAHDRAVELRALGQDGLGEIRDAARHKRDLARARLDRLAREAQALRLLHDTLTDAEREAKRTFLGPVTSRIEPYLRLLFPGTEVALDDAMGISHIRRDGLDEPFASLSIGTREQLAILVRLAFADLLREKGHPASLVLDDALVYSDDGRFERMQSILHKAAKGQQIIILTCREREYRHLGAPIIRLSECLARTPAQAAAD